MKIKIIFGFLHLLSTFKTRRYFSCFAICLGSWNLLHINRKEDDFRKVNGVLRPTSYWGYNIKFLCFSLDLEYVEKKTINPY